MRLVDVPSVLVLKDVMNLVVTCVAVSGGLEGCIRRDEAKRCVVQNEVVNVATAPSVIMLEGCRADFGVGMSMVLGEAQVHT